MSFFSTIANRLIPLSSEELEYLAAQTKALESLDALNRKNEELAEAERHRIQLEIDQLEEEAERQKMLRKLDQQTQDRLSHVFTLHQRFTRVGVGELKFVIAFGQSLSGKRSKISQHCLDERGGIVVLTQDTTDFLSTRDVYSLVIGPWLDHTITTEQVKQAVTDDKIDLEKIKAKIIFPLGEM